MSSYGSTKRRTATNTSTAAATIAQYAPRPRQLRPEPPRVPRPARTPAEREALAARWALRQATREHSAASQAHVAELSASRDTSAQAQYTYALERARREFDAQAVAAGRYPTQRAPGESVEDYSARVTQHQAQAFSYVHTHPDVVAAQAVVTARRARADAALDRWDRAHLALNAAKQRAAAAATRLRIERGGAAYDYTFSGDPGLTRQAINYVAGRKVSDEEVGRLAAATVGDTLTAHVIGPNAVAFELKGATRENSFTLQRVHNQLIMEAHVVRNHGPRSSGSGTEVINGFHEMQKFGIRRLNASAARSTSDGSIHNAFYNGYYTWAQLGFVGAIPYNVRAAAAARFGPHVTEVEQIMQQPGGPQWWKEHGDTWQASFDFTPGSYSMRRLARLTRGTGGTGNGSGKGNA